MLFLADESVGQPVLEKLRNEGYEVLAVSELEPGLSDEDVTHMATNNKAIFITADKDFGEISFNKRLLPYGVVLIRLAGLTATRKGQLVATAISEHSNDLSGAFSVIGSNTIRIRKKDH